jgi:hypothetical protein
LPTSAEKRRDPSQIVADVPIPAECLASAVPNPSGYSDDGERCSEGKLNGIPG